MKSCLKCNSFYSECTFINKILKFTWYCFYYFWRGGVILLGVQRVLALGTGPCSQMMTELCTQGHLFMKNQSYQLVEGVAVELPHKGRFLLLEIRHNNQDRSFRCLWKLSEANR